MRVFDKSGACEFFGESERLVIENAAVDKLHGFEFVLRACEGKLLMCPSLVVFCDAGLDRLRGECEGECRAGKENFFKPLEVLKIVVWMQVDE
ncbi:MAG: hypothetical protein RBT63_08535 [Bdellovibrionales bacterium]|nr:hypothetical protein [Bdellovibrionales bacterium]